MKIVQADPAGNITLLVLDPVEREERAAAASRLMADPQWGAEQVGFLCPPQLGGEGRLEMAGGEFCGNAARAFGLLLARRRGCGGTVLLEISGAQRPITAQVDLEAGTARAEMPLPREERGVEVDGRPCVLVDLGGIVHLVAEGVPPSQAFFERAESLLGTFRDAGACGVIFLEGKRLTPLVKVPEAGTLVWEGSCGSGSLAAAVYQSRGREGSFTADYAQPAGTVTAHVVRTGGTITSAWIGGAVKLGETVEIDLL